MISVNEEGYVQAVSRIGIAKFYNDFGSVSRVSSLFSSIIRVYEKKIKNRGKKKNT